MLDLLHTLFEFSEHALDLLIEHLFHTTPRTTEIIVFYIMLSIVGFTAFKLMQALPSWYSRLIEQMVNFWDQEKAKALTHWESQFFIEKINWRLVSIAGIACIVLLIFS
jgi:hypothetical protein